MHLTIDQQGMVVTSHAGQDITWNTSILERTDYVNNPHLFREINGFFATLKPEKQQIIWECYRSIWIILENVSERGRLAKAISEQLKIMYDQFPYKDIDWWVGVHGNIRYPDSKTIPDVHDAYDQNPDRTYLRRDYTGLINLTVLLRPAIPVIAEYMRRIRDEVGTEYKEYIAMRIMRLTHVMSSEPVERLQRYLSATLNVNAANANSHIISGLGTEETVQWLLAMVCIRRISVGTIDATESSGNIITNIFGFVSNALRAFDKRFGGGFRERKVDSDTAEDEGSIVESYRAKQEVSPADILLYNFYTEDPIRMGLKIDPTCDVVKLQKCLAAVQTISSLPIMKHQKILTQWALHTVIPAEAIPLLHKPELLRAIAVTQALLWHWGLNDLASLVTAKRHIDDDFMVTFDAKVRLSKERDEALQKLFPHQMPDEKGNNSRTKNNYATNAISLMIRELSGNHWVHQGPPELTAACQHVDYNKRSELPADIGEQLAQMIINIHSVPGNPAI